MPILKYDDFLSWKKRKDRHAMNFEEPTSYIEIIFSFIPWVV